MKKSELRKIIKEEISKVLSEDQMGMSFKTFEDIKDEMREWGGFKETFEGFSLPALGIMGDTLKSYYEFKKVDDQTVNVKKFAEENEEEGFLKVGEKNHPLSVFADFIEEYGS